MTDTRSGSTTSPRRQADLAPPRKCNGRCNVTAMPARTCALCLEPIPDEEQAVQARVSYYRTRRRWVRPAWSGRAVICLHCATLGQYQPSADGLRDARYPEPAERAEPVPCVNCGLPVILRVDKRRKVAACSDSCRAQFYASNKPVTKAVTPCEGCGAEMTGRTDRRYCSPACRQRAYRQRNVPPKP